MIPASSLTGFQNCVMTITDFTHRIWGRLNTVQCRYNAVNFLINAHNRHPIARPWGRGMECLSSVSDLCSTVAIAVLYVTSYTRPRYNGTRLYKDVLFSVSLSSHFIMEIPIAENTVFILKRDQVSRYIIQTHKINVQCVYRITMVIYLTDILHKIIPVMHSAGS